MRDILNILRTPIRKGKEVFVAPTATAIGDITLGDECSVWFGAVLRGDGDSITIGDRSNIQDNAVVHVDPGDPVVIGTDCIIGHKAIIHGARLGDHVLIGMNAVVLNNARIGDYCLIGANSLVTANMEIPEGSLVLGNPAKVVKQLSEEQKEKIRKNAEVYVALSKHYLEFYKS